MCCDMNAYCSRVTQNVFFNSAPTASVGRVAKGNLTGYGAYPRERRIGRSRS